MIMLRCHEFGVFSEVFFSVLRFDFPTTVDACGIMGTPGDAM